MCLLNIPLVFLWHLQTTQRLANRHHLVEIEHLKTWGDLGLHLPTLSSELDHCEPSSGDANRSSFLSPPEREVHYLPSNMKTNSAVREFFLRNQGLCKTLPASSCQQWRGGSLSWQESFSSRKTGIHCLVLGVPSSLFLTLQSVNHLGVLCGPSACLVPSELWGCQCWEQGMSSLRGSHQFPTFWPLSIDLQGSCQPPGSPKHSASTLLVQKVLIPCTALVVWILYFQSPQCCETIQKVKKKNYKHKIFWPWEGGF